MSFSASQVAFNPTGNTVAITANNPAPTGVTALPRNPDYTLDVGQFRVVNSSTGTIIHLGWGATAAAAATNAAAAASGTPAAGLPILPGGVEVLRFTPGVFFSAFASSASTVFITPGQGL